MEGNIYQKLLTLNEKHMFQDRFQSKVLKEYIKEFQKELADFTVSYEGNDIRLQSKKFKDVKIKVNLDYSMDKDNAEAGMYFYGENTICINPELLKKPADLAAVIAHEATHALEDYHMMNVKKFAEHTDNPCFHKYIDMLSIYINNKPFPVNCMNFKDMGNGSLHFEPQTKAKMENDYVYKLSTIFYALHKSETEAYRVGEQEMKNFCDYYNQTHDDKIHPANNYSTTSKAAQQFKERYNLTKSNNVDTEVLYNKCFMKIHEQAQPENELEANIMYDMACLALYNYRVQQNPQVEEYEHEKANELIDDIAKQRNLRQYGFDFIHPAGHIHHLTFDAPSYMKFIGNEEAFLSEDVFFKKDNMKIFLMIAPEIGSRITEYIPDMDLLKQMCVNDRDELINSGSELMEDGIRIIFGEEFWNQLNEIPVENIEGTDDIGNSQYEMHSAIVFQNPETEYEDDIEL